MGAGWLAGRGRLILHSLALPREDWVICFVGLGAALGKTPGRISCCPFPVLPVLPHHTYHTISQACLLEGRVPVLFTAVSTAPINDYMLNR